MRVSMAQILVAVIGVHLLVTVYLIHTRWHGKSGHKKPVLDGRDITPAGSTRTSLSPPPPSSLPEMQLQHQEQDHPGMSLEDLHVSFPKEEAPASSPSTRMGMLNDSGYHPVHHDHVSWITDSDTRTQSIPSEQHIRRCGHC